MSKQHSKAKQVRQVIATFLAITVFIVPVILTGIWVGVALSQRDHRSVEPAAPFHARSVDQTTAPLQPFTQPLLSVSFDDGWESVYTTAFPLLQRYGFHTTQYVITDTFSNPLYMSVAQLRSMESTGTEIASHTVSHPDLTTLNAQELTRELADSQKTLRQDFGGGVLDFTSPYGAYNAYTLKMIGTYYRSQKNAEGDPAANELEAINVGANFDPLNFKSYSVRGDTTLADLKKLVTATQAEHAWLVLTYHQIDDSKDTFSVTPEAFQAQLAYLSQTTVRDAPVSQVMDAYFAQHGRGQ